MQLRLRTQFILGLLVVAQADVALAHIIETQWNFPTESATGHVFALNPALAHSADSSLTLGIVREANEDIVTLNDDTQTFTSTGSYTGSGVITHLTDGFSASLTAQFIESRVQGYSSRRDSFQEESRLGRLYQGRLALRMSEMFEAGILVRYWRISGDVLGAFDVNPTDRTIYKSALIGVGIGGAVHLGNRWTVALTHLPRPRGKAQVAGEDKIVTEHGVSVLQGHLRLNRRWTLGGLYQRWQHARDELSRPSTSPTQSRPISLNGLDFGQYLLISDVLGIGADYYTSKIFGIRAAAFWEKGAFIRAPDTLPGDNPDVEVPIKYLRYMLGFVFHDQNFEAQAGLAFSERAKSSLTLPSRTDGGNAAAYTNYRAIDRRVLINLSARF